MKGWLTSAGIDWLIPVNVVVTDTTNRIDIKKLKDWEAFKNANIDMDSLSMSEAESLQDLFKERKWDNKKAKDDKKEAWKKIGDRLHKLRTTT